MPELVYWRHPRGGPRRLISFKADPRAQDELSRHSCVRRMWETESGEVFADIEFLRPASLWEPWLEEVQQVVGLIDLKVMEVVQVWERS